MNIDDIKTIASRAALCESAALPGQQLRDLTDIAIQEIEKRVALEQRLEEAVHQLENIRQQCNGFLDGPSK